MTCSLLLLTSLGLQRRGGGDGSESDDFAEFTSDLDEEEFDNIPGGGSPSASIPASGAGAGQGAGSGSAQSGGDPGAASHDADADDDDMGIEEDVRRTITLKQTI